VDSTVRSAAALGFEVVVASDCHTVADRPHLGAERIIEHHEWVWRNLISHHSVRVVPSEEI
jgi:nicotinamidase-related amidase